jgi:hypothetical protein
MVIINLTQHDATPDQIAAGVIEPDPETKATVRGLLTFGVLPEPRHVLDRAMQIAAIAQTADVDAALIGGAGFIMGPLAQTLRNVGMIPLHAFSIRESTEERQPDGSARKIATFRFIGFVEDVTD